MIVRAFADLPPLKSGTRISVGIPARDEAAFIARCLGAFAGQRDLDGRALRPGGFEIVVYANGCRDATAAVAVTAGRAMPNVRVHVVEAAADADERVGSARKRVMDAAAQRLLAAGLPRGIVGSVDADTVVAPTWIAWLDREMRDADAVAGTVSIGEGERAAMHAHVRVLYVRELTYRRLVAEAEAELDPRPEDPAPRHASFVGAAFGVTARAYCEAGGIPPLARLEDAAFAAALRRIDARIRHSLRLRATTSARMRPRVDGGFGTFVAHLAERGARGGTFLVEPGRYWLDSFAARAALRRIWGGGDDATDVDAVAARYALDERTWRPLVDLRAPFGATLARVEAAATRVYAPEPVEAALAALRHAAASRKPATPTRTSAASGAG